MYVNIGWLIGALVALLVIAVDESMGLQLGFWPRMGIILVLDVALVLFACWLKDRMV